jgi:starch synthase (maltosyl-transferring)
LPEIDAGAHPVKRVVGDLFTVGADLVADGHDVLGGALLYRGPGDDDWRTAPLRELVNDRWEASILLDELGTWHYTIEGWVDHAATWRKHLRARFEGGVFGDLPVELQIGAELVAAAARRASGADASQLHQLAVKLADDKLPVDTRVLMALADDAGQVLAAHPDRERASRYGRTLAVAVDRPRARFSAWYEMFPRSCGAAGAHGTFRDAEERLGYVAELGFDVLYLPPIHPIGSAFRKGKNNTLTPLPDDVGSPWAVGSRDGGHTAIHPQLGGAADFKRFLRAAADRGLEVALDIAFQCSPDHPWVAEHPTWFRQRPDGSIQYAENPPKKYQDIYPLDFDSEDWWPLWQALRDVFLHWIGQGVKIFRVDNPHTKPLRFWSWCIGEIRRAHPDVIFLAEAFTRPKLMYALAKRGFTQSYTYFTWRESAHDLRTYLEELTSPPVVEFFRPNFWPNTPDILPDHLIGAGHGAFALRLVLAATLSSSYGIYGPAYELMDNKLRPGSGEYLDSEKYELKRWELNRPVSLRPLIKRVNKIRRENPALHDNRLLRFHGCDNPALLCYSKRTEDRSNVVLVVVNVDPSWKQGGFVDLDLGELGLTGGPFHVRDLIGNGRYLWHGARNFVELEPSSMPAHVFVIEPS